MARISTCQVTLLPGQMRSKAGMKNATILSTAQDRRVPARSLDIIPRCVEKMKGLCRTCSRIESSSKLRLTMVFNLGEELEYNTVLTGGLVLPQELSFFFPRPAKSLIGKHTLLFQYYKWIKG